MQKPRFTNQPTRTERWGRRGTYGKGPRSLEPGLFCEFRAQAEQAPQRSRQRQSQCVLKHQGQWEEVQFNQHHRQDTARSQPPGLLCSFQTLLALCFLPIQGRVLSLMPMSRDGEGEVKSPVFSHPPSFPARLCFHVKPLTGLDPGPRVPTPLYIPSPFMQTQLPWGLRSAMSRHHMG